MYYYNFSLCVCKFTILPFGRILQVVLQSFTSLRIQLKIMCLTTLIAWTCMFCRKRWPRFAAGLWSTANRVGVSCKLVRSLGLLLKRLFQESLFLGWNRALVSNMYSHFFSFDSEPFSHATNSLCLFPSCNRKLETAATYTRLPPTAVLLCKGTESPTAMLCHDPISVAASASSSADSSGTAVWHLTTSPSSKRLLINVLKVNYKLQLNKTI
jgi:hypothetical protein